MMSSIPNTGLGRPQFNFLGPRLMFPNRLHYYGVMIADLVLRFMWVLTLIPPNSGASFELPVSVKHENYFLLCVLTCHT